MPPPDAPFKIAAVQAAPVFLDREATAEKACRLIAEAASQGARLIVFPESFIPAYPDWVWAVPPGRGKILNPLYADFLANAVEVPGAATERLAQAVVLADSTWFERNKENETGMERSPNGK